MGKDDAECARLLPVREKERCENEAEQREQQQTPFFIHSWGVWHENKPGQTSKNRYVPPVMPGICCSLDACSLDATSTAFVTAAVIFGWFAVAF